MSPAQSQRFTHPSLVREVLRALSCGEARPFADTSCFQFSFARNAVVEGGDLRLGGMDHATADRVKPSAERSATVEVMPLLRNLDESPTS